MKLAWIYRLADTPGPSGTRCWIFAWLGQGFQHCDDCGRPVHEHLFHPPYGSARPLFHVKQLNHRGDWVWKPVGSLVKANAEEAVS